MSRWIGLASAIAASFSAAVAFATPLDTLPVERAAVPRVISVDGVVEAVHQSTVSAQASGRIAEVLFDVDDYVAKGEVIVRFRDAEPKARLAQARAVEGEAQAAADEARRERERIRGIYAQRLVAKADLDRAEAAAEAATARLAQAQARVREAEEQLEHTRVRAPYAGLVVRRHVQVGELASPGQPLMTGLSLERLRVTATLPQSQVEAARAMGRATVLAGAVSLNPEKITIFPIADPATHTVRMRLDLPRGVTGLAPGMFVKVAVALGEREALLVPAVAVARRGEVSGVYVVDDRGRVALRQVRIGEAQGDRVEILSGLDAGERVALDPVRAVIRAKQGAGAPAP